MDRHVGRRRVNDAAALATADRGIAIGSGTGVAVQAADLVLVGDGLSVLPTAIRLAGATIRTVRGILAWAFGYNLAALPLAVVGLFNPLMAGAGNGVVVTACCVAQPEVCAAG